MNETIAQKGLFSLLRFLDMYIFSLVLILNREILDGEPGYDPGDSYKKNSYKKTVYVTQNLKKNK